MPFDPDRAPFDQLPMFWAQTTRGPIEVVRGQLELDAVPPRHLATALRYPGEHFAVFTNSFGELDVYRRGELVDPELDPSRIGHQPYRQDSEFLRTVSGRYLPLPEVVTVMREMADWYLQIAETYQELVDAGWVNDPGLAADNESDRRASADMRDTTTGTSFAPAHSRSRRTRHA